MATKSTPSEILYVTRDIERALGIEPGENYFILTNRTAYSEIIAKKYPGGVFLADSKETLDTYALLKAGEKHIQSGTHILVFKNTARIEELCAEKKWTLLNPPAALAEKIENKITQVEWLKKGKIDAQKYLPPHAIKKVSEIKLKNKEVSAPFMIQWAHGHTGEGTIFVGADKTGEKTLAALREKFPDREARITSYIQGPVFTMNICIMPGEKTDKKTDKKTENTVVGNISNQITGTLPFTDNPWTTVGNDWSLPQSILSEERIAQLQEIARAVGRRMSESGWMGLFGIDCIYDVERDNLHLIEVNARQPASTTFESQLQEKTKALAPEHFKKSVTMFEAHIAALRNSKNSKATTETNFKPVEINDGAQIILRVASIKEMRKNPAELKEITDALIAKNYKVIEYPNMKAGEDLLRIQSDRGIMESHTKFNERGKEILETVTGV